MHSSNFAFAFLSFLLGIKKFLFRLNSFLIKQEKDSYLFIYLFIINYVMETYVNRGNFPKIESRFDSSFAYVCQCPSNFNMNYSFRFHFIKDYICTNRFAQQLHHHDKLYFLTFMFALKNFKWKSDFFEDSIFSNSKNFHSFEEKKKQLLL